MARNYYDILGIDKDASQEEIKKAYRHQASINHPDISNDPNASEKMKMINEAYATLKDPEKRANYDQYGDSTYNTNFNEQNNPYSNYNPSRRQYEYTSGFIFPKSAFRFARVILFLVVASFLVNGLWSLISSFVSGYSQSNDYSFDYRYDATKEGLAISSVNCSTFRSRSITEIEIPRQWQSYEITTISSNCFSNCPYIETIHLTSSITTIDANAFKNCGNLTTIYYEGTIEEFYRINISPVGNNYFLEANIIPTSDVI